MELKVNRKKDRIINVLDMEDGQVGEIFAWENANYIGSVIQRHGELLLAVGRTYDEGWGQLFSGPRKQGFEKCLVRLLQKGDAIEVVG